MQCIRIRKTESTHEPYALMLSTSRSIANNDRTAHNTGDSTIKNLRHTRVATRRLWQLDGPHFARTETLIFHIHPCRPLFQLLLATPRQFTSHRFSLPPSATTTSRYTSLDDTIKTSHNSKNLKPRQFVLTELQNGTASLIPPSQTSNVPITSTTTLS